MNKEITNNNGLNEILNSVIKLYLITYTSFMRERMRQLVS